MAYGTVKVDNITFDNGGSDQNVTVSGLYRATTSGVTVSGTIVAATVSGVTIIGSTTVSGATVTGTTANFTSGNFSNIISSAATMSGALIMANQQQVRFREAGGTNHIALQAPASVVSDQTITLPEQTGTLITTGDNGSVSSTMLATNLTISAAAGSATTPSIAFTGDLNTGIYSPGADQLAVATNGTGRLFVDASGSVGIGTSSPGVKLHIADGQIRVANSGAINPSLVFTGNGAGASGFQVGQRYNAQELFIYDLAALADRVVVDSAGRVGIGTASPSEKLHVAGIILGDSNDNYFGSYSSGGAYLDVGNLATSAAWIDARSTSLANVPLNIRAKGTGEIAFHQTSGEKVRIDSSGRVGIGTSSPTQLLSLAGTSANILLAGTSNSYTTYNIGASNVGYVGDANWIFAGSSSDFGIRATSNLVFGIGATERLRIDSSGRVGIGTSSPGTTLEVSAGGGSSPSLTGTGGNFAITQPGLVTSLEFGGYGSAPYGLWLQTKNKTGGSFPLILNPLGGAVGIGTSSPGTALEVNGAAKASYSIASGGLSAFASSSGGLYTYFSSGASVIQSAADNSGTAAPLLFVSGSERLRIDSSGRVGIGTSSPSHAIHVSGANAVTSSIQLTTTANSDAAIRSTTALGSFAFGTGIGSATNCWNVYDINATTERLRIDSSGRVGIGTSSPNTTLHVYGGDGKIQKGVSATDISELTFSNAYRTGRILSSYTNPASVSETYIAFHTNRTGEANDTVGEAMRIAGGRVGIGTSSPGYALDVAASDTTASTGYAVRIRANATAGAGALQFTDSAATVQYGLLVFDANGVGTLQAEGASSRLVFGTNSTERLRIDSSGNVGIGTSSPDSTLQVIAGAVAGFRVGYNNTSVNYYDADTQIFRAIDGSERIRIDSSGNVGIGTSSPTTLLDVNADTVRVRAARTPASATATGANGEICWDANYIYVCTATNTWRRSAISSW
jgi:hypothetical protein